MLNKPFIKKGFINQTILNWDDFENLKNNHPKEEVELLQSNGPKMRYYENSDININDYSIIFTGCRDFKKEFHTLHKFFKLLIPNLPDIWDAHIYSGHNDNATSFKMHFDAQDNFLIQCQGKARLYVPNYFDTIVEPGDLSWIPKYVPHVMVPIGRRLSVSFPHFELKEKI